MSYTTERDTCVVDSECFPNYWSISFKCVKTGRTRLFEFFDGNALDRAAIARIMRNWRIVTFNGNKYDIPMILLAMRPETTVGELKQANDQLIPPPGQIGPTPWRFMEHHGLEIPEFIDHIDLMEVNPGAAAKPSLKICGGRLHSRRMQDLPFEVDRWITAEDRVVMRSYLANDLDTTIDLYNELKPQLDLRAVMSDQYKVDLRSRSDAQIAEAVIKAEVERITKRRAYRPDVQPGVFYYQPPSFVRFETPMMRELLHEIRKTPFVINAKGVVEMPKNLADKKIVIGNSTYRMGIGGLHSSEESVCYVANGDYLLLDRDVASYYPSIILGTGLTPKHLGEAFITVYRKIFETRLEAKELAKKYKKEGDAAKQRHYENVAESLKIVLNGSFGKLGSPYSILYSPNLMIQTTVGGQLMILMLIEQLELWGISVVSANTDGIVSKVPVERRDSFRGAVFDWECATGFLTEETEYLLVASRDVNGYVAKAIDRKSGATSVKTKGPFAPSGPGLKGAMGLKKNPAAQIAVDAAVKYLCEGAGIEQTIRACTDVRQFVVVRRVSGGAYRDIETVIGDEDLVDVPVPIGKALRWYYSTEQLGPLLYLKDDKTVPRSDNARPLLELPPDHAIPHDLDYDWYIREAYAILQDVGLGAIDPSLKGRSGMFLGRKEKAKNFHYVAASTGIAVCGTERDSIREKWIEAPYLPVGHRLCAKCRKGTEL